MKPFRDPFSMETAEGFPVDGLYQASLTHAHRERDGPKQYDEMKNKANQRKRPKTKERG